ncbi:MAG TPA: hypothetical protein VHB98_11590 [Chloroflexota bacterium]|nr:hypothetical protein [Chloroflexota bacterium]
MLTTGCPCCCAPEADRQTTLWQGHAPERLSIMMRVNLSARQFQHPVLVEDVAQVAAPGCDLGQG